MGLKRTIRKVYELTPFRKEVFTVLRNFWQPNESLEKYLYFSGVFEIAVDKNHAFRMNHYGFTFSVENEIFWRSLANAGEKLSVSLWSKLVKDAEVIFDVGANTGIYSLIAKTLKPEAAIYAFEPVKRVYEKLAENISLNNYEVVCLEKALSNNDGTAIVYDLPNEHIYSVTVGKNLNADDVATIPTIIETARVETIINFYNLKKIDLMKIDVETHEAEVLEGMGKYLQLYKPTMLIEILNDEVGEKVEKIVEGNDYLYFNINDVSGTVKQTAHIKKSDFYNYLLCSGETAKFLGLLPNR